MYRWHKKIIEFKRNLIKEFCQHAQDRDFLCKVFRVKTIDEIPENQLDNTLDLCERTENRRAKN